MKGEEMQESLKKVLGERIKKIRGSRNQQKFAEDIGSIQQTISKYERGGIPENWFFLVRLVQEEGVDLNELLVGAPNTRSDQVRDG